MSHHKGMEGAIPVGVPDLGAQVAHAQAKHSAMLSMRAHFGAIIAAGLAPQFLQRNTDSEGNVRIEIDPVLVADISVACAEAIMERAEVARFRRPGTEADEQPTQ